MKLCIIRSLLAAMLLIGRGSIAYAADFASVDVPIDVTYTASVSVSTNPDTIDFGTIVPGSGVTINKPFDIVINSSHPQHVQLWIEVISGQIMPDLHSIDFAGGEFKLLADGTNCIPHPAFALNGSKYKFPVSPGNHICRTTARQSIYSAAAVGTYTAAIRINVSIV